MSEKDPNLHQILFRIHRDDYLLVRKLLTDDGLKFQSFVAACVEAYLRGDPPVMKIVRDWKEMRDVPPEHRAKYKMSKRDRDRALPPAKEVPTGKETLSPRERRSLLDELEQANTLGED